MKYILLIFIFFLSCEVYIEDFDPVIYTRDNPSDSLSAQTHSDTSIFSIILNYKWDRFHSFRNDTLVVLRTEFIDTNDELEYFYHSYYLFAEDYGLYSFNFRDNYIINTFNNEIYSYDNIKIKNDTIKMYSYNYGNRDFKIEAILKDFLFLSYTSSMNNKIEIHLLRCSN